MGAGPDLESPEVRTQVILDGLALVFRKKKWQDHRTPELWAGLLRGEACGISGVGCRAHRKQ